MESRRTAQSLWERVSSEGRVYLLAKLPAYQKSWYRLAHVRSAMDLPATSASISAPQSGNARHKPRRTHSSRPPGRCRRGDLLGRFSQACQPAACALNSKPILQSMRFCVFAIFSAVVRHLVRQIACGCTRAALTS